MSFLLNNPVTLMCHQILLCLFFYYRPSIADQVHVGYFSQDRSSQTDVSEIAQLKEMTEVLQKLVRVGAELFIRGFEKYKFGRGSVTCTKYYRPFYGFSNF